MSIEAADVTSGAVFTLRDCVVCMSLFSVDLGVVATVSSAVECTCVLGCAVERKFSVLGRIVGGDSESDVGLTIGGVATFDVTIGFGARVVSDCFDFVVISSVDRRIGAVD